MTRPDGGIPGAAGWVAVCTAQHRAVPTDCSAPLLPVPANPAQALAHAVPGSTYPQGTWDACPGLFNPLGDSKALKLYKSKLLTHAHFGSIQPTKDEQDGRVSGGCKPTFEVGSGEGRLSNDSEAEYGLGLAGMVSLLGVSGSTGMLY